MGPKEGRTGKRGVVIAADGWPFVASFPGSSLEPPRFQLCWSLLAGVAERKGGEKGQTIPPTGFLQRKNFKT